MFRNLIFLAFLPLLLSFQKFSFNSSTFLLDDKPITIISGELHFSRIPPEYWSHRLKMAKAMGLNTIATYVFWNFHQSTEEIIDFESASRDLGRFIRLAQEEGLFVLLRPGPYTCGEWDYGGFPHWFLKYDDIKVRSYDQQYLAYVERFFRRLAEIIVPLQITNGGPIVMVQLENEFGSYGTDHPYIEYLKKLWLQLGITVPFYSADGGWKAAVISGHVIGAAIGLDSGNTKEAYDVATQVDPLVVSFSSESYPGWLTHWGEQWAGRSTDDICNEVDFILGCGKSFNLYVVHGGTNFGFWAGANDGDKGYQPDVTSYDYDAPITENGVATDKYYALKKVISKYKKEPIPDPPEPIKTITFDKVQLEEYSSIWSDSLGHLKAWSRYPKFFEIFDQASGLIIYRTNLTNGETSGKLRVNGLADYAIVFVDDVFLGYLDRVQAVFEIDLPTSGRIQSKLEIVVEGMGRINFGHQMTDRKGINGNVSLENKTPI